MRTAELNFDISLRKNRCQLCDCIDFSAHVQHSNFSASSQAGRVGLFKVNDNLREFFPISFLCHGDFAVLCFRCFARDFERQADFEINCARRNKTKAMFNI